MKANVFYFTNFLDLLLFPLPVIVKFTLRPTSLLYSINITMEVAKLKDDNKKVVVAQQFKVPSQRWIKPKKILTEDEFSQVI